jgi:LmbE family N-acetylglucosaminyl deacetylase
MDILEQFSKRDRIRTSTAVIVAHPDDETIGMGGMMQLFENLTIICCTDGAPAALPPQIAKLGIPTVGAYRTKRMIELMSAMDLSGAQYQLVTLGIQDQKLIYNAFELTQLLIVHLGLRKCKVVLSHPYEGGHPDHDAVAFAVQAASIALSNTDAGFDRYEFTGYFDDEGGNLVTGQFLPSNRIKSTFNLSAAEQRRKRLMIECFASQRETLIPFSTSQETFRFAPTYNFLEPPSPWPVRYERFPHWEITSLRWIAEAREAVRQGGLNQAV